MRDRPFGAILAKDVRKRARALVREAAIVLPRGRPGELHALRIDVKRLRYALELLAPLARDECQATLDLLARLQERLGALADADTFAKTCAALRERLPARDPREPGLATLAANARRDREGALAAIHALWSGEGASYPERLAASVSATLASVSANSPYAERGLTSNVTTEARARSKRSAL